MRNLELRRVNSFAVYTCSVCRLDYRTHGFSYYDTQDGQMVCNECAEGPFLTEQVKETKKQDDTNFMRAQSIYSVENVHYVGVSDKRDIVIFNGAEEVRISQRSILNHKKIVALVLGIQSSLASIGYFETDTWLDRKTNELLAEEENGPETL